MLHSELSSTLASHRTIHGLRVLALDSEYTAECDGIDEESWHGLLQEFDDASIYQTWPYADIIAGPRRVSRLVVRRCGEAVAMAQVRIARLPLAGLGIAYVQWGPVWRRRSTDPDPEHLRQALRALRNEFVGKRRLALRLFPLLFNSDGEAFSSIFEAEGFALDPSSSGNRTILMDLAPPAEALREGMRAHWKRELKVAERHQMQVVEGSQAELFEQFIAIYKEMVARKKFAEPNDIHQFCAIQARLPEALKMQVMLCRSEKGTCAGVIASAIGNTAMYLFGATSNDGMKSRGSYLLQWKLLEYLKQRGCAFYNLNGINPAVNPGTYKFKSDLAGEHGQEVAYRGRYQAHPNLVSGWSADLAYKLLRTGRMLKAVRWAPLGVRNHSPQAR